MRSYRLVEIKGLVSGRDYYGTCVYVLVYLIWLLSPVRVCAQLSQPTSLTPVKNQLSSVSGAVLRRADGSPLRKAIVRLTDSTDGGKATSVTTTPDGKFLITGVSPGTYRLAVSKIGYVTQEYGQTNVHSSYALLSVSRGKDISDLIFKLPATGTIAGHVRDENSDAAPLIHVSAFRLVYFEGKKVVHPESQTLTNDLGEYRLFNLKPGRYFVVGSPAQQSVDPRPQKLDPYALSGYSAVFYPGTSDIAKAERITVKSGDELQGFDLRLEPSQAAKVKGSVQIPISGRVGRQALVMLLPKNYLGRWDSHALAALPKALDGSFEISNVPAGQYYAVAQLEEEGKVFSARRVVDVGDAPVEGVVLTLSRGQNLVGHLSWEPNSQPSSNDLLVDLLPLEDGQFAPPETAVRSDGSFSVTDVSEGSYHLMISGLAKNAYLKQIRSDDDETSPGQVTIGQASVGHLELSLSSQGAQIDGQVVDKDSIPAAGTWVALVPEPSQRKYSWLYRSITTDQNGRFSIRGIPPGNYKLFSWDDVEEGAWEDEDFLSSFEDLGTTVDLKESGRQNIELVTLGATDKPSQTSELASPH